MKPGIFGNHVLKYFVAKVEVHTIHYTVPSFFWGGGDFVSVPISSLKYYNNLSNYPLFFCLIFFCFLNKAILFFIT